LSDGTKYLINYWWITVMAGLLLFVALVSLNIIGAALERSRNQISEGIH
jgi:peptide/nickel transport system permease protein